MKRCCAMEDNACATSESKTRSSIVCPKPRRFCSITNGDDHSETNDLKAGKELLDIIVSKRNIRSERSINQVASSPPFYSGSPPNRVSNPLVQDEHFGSGTSRKGGCVRMKYSQKPAAMRIEGFDCLNRDGQNCSISAVA